MPEQIDTPSNTGAENDWGLWGSAATSKVQAVAKDNGDKSVIFASSGGRLVVQDYQFPELLGVADPVNSASLTAVTRQYLAGAGGRGYSLLWNSVSSGVNKQVPVHLAAPNYISVEYSVSGSDLALDAVNGEHGVRFTAAGGPSNKAEYWVTHLFRTVDFDYVAGSAGGFAHHVGALIGFLIGGGLLLSEMPKMAAFLALNHGFRLRKDELEPCWRDLKARKHLVVV